MAAGKHQRLAWALKASCAVRSRDGAARPEDVLRVTRPLRRVVHAYQRRNLVNGVYVVSSTLKYQSGVFIEVPRKVCRVSDLLEPYGGLRAVTAACEACPANATRDIKGGMAGCCGRLEVDPEDVELDRRIREAILATERYQAWKKAFKATTPVWFGFWTRSPLSPEQSRLLLEVLSRTFTRDRKRGRGIPRFLGALRTAVEQGLLLEVSLSPPGHNEAGFKTVYPHCPACKAEANVDPGLHDVYPPEPYTCPVCHHTFFPAATHEVEIEDGMANPVAGDIEDVLTGEEARAFLRVWMIRSGASEQEVERLIASRRLAG